MGAMQMGAMAYPLLFCFLLVHLGLGVVGASRDPPGRPDSPRESTLRAKQHSQQWARASASDASAPWSRSTDGTILAQKLAEEVPMDVASYLYTGDSNQLKRANCSSRHELAGLPGKSPALASSHPSLHGALDTLTHATNFLNMMLHSNKSREQNLQDDLEWYRALVRSLLEGEPSISQEAITFSMESLSAPALRVFLQATREESRILLQDLSSSAHHLANAMLATEWFHGLRRKWRTHLHRRGSNQGPRGLGHSWRRRDGLSGDKSHVNWSPPYLECENGSYKPGWLVTLSAAFYRLQPNLVPEFRKSRLRVVDFRRDPDLIEPNYSFEDAVDSPFLYSAWMEPEVPKTKVRQRRSLRKKPSQDWQPLDLYINISLDTWYRNTLVSCILRKVQHSCRPLRLFCGKLHIRNVVFSQTVEILDLVQLEFIQELDVSDCFGLFSGESQFARQVEQMKNLRNLMLPQPIFETTAVHRLLPSDAFNSFLSRLSSLGRLQMLRLSSPHLSDHLHRLLRYLSDALVTLELPACALLIRDICWLSQSPQASHLKKLDLSKNDLSQMVPGVLEALLREASGFLQELVLDYCSLRDPHLVGLLPALRCCFLLYSLSLSGNRIATSILENLLQLVAELSELKLVVCPYPVECYDYPKSRELGQIQERRSSSVEAMVQDMLWALGQESLEWTFTSETSF